MTSLDRRRVLHPGLHWVDFLRAANISQAEAARQMHISPKHLNGILRGRAMPSADLTIRFADLVHASPRLLWRQCCDYQLDLALGAEDVTPQ